jgi:hypothetical protein
MDGNGDKLMDRIWTGLFRRLVALFTRENGHNRYEIRSTSFGETASIQVAPLDPARELLIISYRGSDPVRLTPARPGSTDSGVAISHQSGPLVLTRGDHGRLAQCEWYLSAVTAAALPGTPITVVEMIQVGS